MKRMEKIRLWWRPNGIGLVNYLTVASHHMQKVGQGRWIYTAPAGGEIAYFKEIDGVLVIHREDGPAVSRYGNHLGYYLNGTEVSNKEVLRSVRMQVLPEDLICLSDLI